MNGWNVLATSLEGQRDTLLSLLRRFGRFRRAGYRNVVVGRVDDVAAVLDGVRDALASDPFLPRVLAKLLPIETTVRIEPRTAVATLVDAAEPFLDRLAGGSFFVRLERRGLKGQLHTPTLEREVAEARGAMLDAALTELEGYTGEAAEALRGEYAAARTASSNPARPATQYDDLRMLAVAAERRLLVEWRQRGRIFDDTYHLLEDELDRAELHAGSLGATSLEG